MLSPSIQPGNALRSFLFPSEKASLEVVLKASIPMKHRAFSLHPSSIIDLRSRPITIIQRLLASAETVTAETSTEDPVDAEKLLYMGFVCKVKVVVKQIEKPRVVLKFIWMEKNIGLGLDQVIPGHGAIPLSPYFFWPRKDAWEELKATLESKPWISHKNTIILLNQATDIINLWQQSGGNLSP